MVRGACAAPDYWELDDTAANALMEAANERDKAWAKFARFCTGIIAAEVRNTLRSKTSQRVWSADDFMPRQVQKLPPEKVRELFVGWAQANGAKVTHG